VLYVLLGPETWQLVTAELDHDAPAYQQWLDTTLGATFSAPASQP
jgi:hypothetical protein